MNRGSPVAAPVFPLEEIAVKQERGIREIEAAVLVAARALLRIPLEAGEII
jgi:hypothetical protein